MSIEERAGLEPDRINNIRNYQSEQETWGAISAGISAERERPVMVAQLGPAAPAEVRPPATLAQIQGFITGLNSDDWRTRERSTQSLREQGVRALPQMMAALGNTEITLEQRRRLEGLMSGFQNAQFPALIDGLSNADVNVRNAATALMAGHSTDDILERVTRGNFSAEQQTALRGVLSSRLSPQQLEQLYGGDLRTKNPSMTQMRARLGYAMLMDNERIPDASAALGRHMLRSDNRELLPEAARLLEVGTRSQNADVRVEALGNLATAQYISGNNQAFLQTMRRAMPIIAATEATSPGTTRRGYDDALQLLDTVLQFGPQDRADATRQAVQTLRNEYQTASTQFDARNPRTGKKPDGGP